MADVFLSYRNTVERRAFVKRIALILRAHELSVWWDYGLEAGESYRAQITDELAKARVVAPLWCSESVASNWVHMEAELGKDKLVPARLQKIVPPADFEAIQAADLIGWDGSVQHPRALAFVAKICERLGKSGRAPVDMMEELAHLPPLSPLPEMIVDVATPSQAPGQDFVLADLRATWMAFSGRNDTAAVERFFARVRGSAPGSGLEFEVEEHLSALRDEGQRRGWARAASEEAARHDAEAKAAAAAEDAHRRTPGAEFRDGEGLPLMVTLPLGSFRMGSPEDEQHRSAREGPVREVRIGYTLAVGKYPVTLGEFRRFVEATGHDMGMSARVWDGEEWKDTRGSDWRNPGFPQDEAHPVTCVNWHDARAYAAWAANLTGQPYRLLSESEWEYACRAGTTTPFSFGATISTSQANYDGNHIYGAGEKGEYRQKTTRVGSFPSNAFGLHDMHGNVWEWCEDVWFNYSGAPTDGSAKGGVRGSRVYRGGAWYFDPRTLRSAYRAGRDSMRRDADQGFRVARTL